MPKRLAEAVREFTQAILDPFDVDDLLDRLLVHAIETMPAAGAGIMLEDEQGHLGFAAASSQLVTRMEALQDRAQTGVCYDAFTLGEVVVVDDLAEHSALERWPGYAERARRLGLVSVIGVPLRAWGQTIGVLNVYRDTPGGWTSNDVDACQILAAMGAGYILNATRMRSQQELAENLRTALASRGTIERAKGIIMGETGVDSDTAFKALRHASMTRNQKLRDVAAEVVDRGWTPPNG